MDLICEGLEQETSIVNWGGKNSYKYIKKPESEYRIFNLHFA